MKNNILLLTVILLASSHVVDAQQRQSRPAQTPPGRPPGPPGAPQAPPEFHLMTVLDANKDGKLTANEITAAPIILLKLDKDKDGKLSREEIGWPPASGFRRSPGGGRGGFPGGFGGGNRGRGGFPGGGFGGFGGAQETPKRPDPDAPPKPKRTLSPAQLQRLDRNKDGEISKNEIPSLLRDVILNTADTNKDGVIDKKEFRDASKPRKK